MAYNFDNDGDYQSISMAIETDGGLLKEAWIGSAGEKWHPALVTDRSTGVRGFDVKPDSTRGKAETIGRKKIQLKEFFVLLANMTSSSSEQVRCRVAEGGHKNSKPISELKFSKRLQNLLIRIGSAP